jgi:glycosidase
MTVKPIIYQMLPRLWGNDKIRPKKNGTLTDNGTGKFSDIDDATLKYLKWLGCSHVWYTGVLRHSTQASEDGCIPSHPQFVKGKAGSPYAICDYYDVNAYLADNPDDRMTEFEQLIKRTHDNGLKLIMDFVPNHVSRDYGKVNPVPGHPVLGSDDDKTVHWKSENDFFYYTGQALTLPTPCPKGMKPYHEMPAMATGNNCYTPEPGINDWYETVKINYGDQHTATWDKMADIIDFWASKGVDGFRCDMVELVPPQFFTWLIRKTKEKYPSLIFIAEVYKKELYRKYIKEVGFDYLYDKSGLYDTLRTVVEKNVNDNGMPVELWQSATGITRNWQFLSDLQPYMLNFLENHDEQRYTSDFFGKDNSNAFAPLFVSLYLNTAPFMIYFGEEVGEKGMDEEGFSGKDGRTTIFDWWSIGSVRRLRKVIGNGEYESMSPSKLTKAGMKPEEAAFFCRFAQAMRFAASDEAVRRGTTYDLCYCNYSSDGFNKDKHFVFLRDFEEHTLLIAANFSQSECRMNITIPSHAFEWMGIPVTESVYPGSVIEITVPPMDAAVLQIV